MDEGLFFCFIFEKKIDWKAKRRFGDFLRIQIFIITEIIWKVI